jgi:hypothetical protein
MVLISLLVQVVGGRQNHPGQEERGVSQGAGRIEAEDLASHPAKKSFDIQVMAQQISADAAMERARGQLAGEVLTTTPPPIRPLRLPVRPRYRIQ